MPTRSCSRLVLACALAAAHLAAMAQGAGPAPRVDASVAAQNRTALAIRTPAGRSYRVEVARDARVAPQSEPQEVQVVATVGDPAAITALVLRDSYPSIPQGMSRCQAGQEAFVRVIALGRETAREIFKAKLESCLDDVETLSGSAGLAWFPEVSTLRLHWLSGPEPGQRDQVKIFRVPAAAPRP